ncbi:esterase-like activity of phytase family protein [Pelagibacterium xiamenense]|uniref:esterase-like activity of phytase family protein n=1 Tax=Pelagibacterium xiamenense TaxID=2901140 RepID=UPI001E537D07|nr:esterase-like activity of phytase family protein [Pelagibacterium xiamenense]MCD7061271.1 esterase-like activity of phytase family protein [Pelagibacterium xiamenense]
MALRAPALAAFALLAAAPACAEPITVDAQRIATFQGARVGEPVDSLVFRGGLELDSTAEDFGGISDIGIFNGTRFVAVIDSGWLLSGQFDYDAESILSGLSAVEITTVTDSAGERPYGWREKDAEALDVIMRDDAPAAIRVGFERITRVLDYTLSANRPVPPARSVAIPGWLSQLRGNETIEALCIAPPASPIAGSTLILTEGAANGSGWAATLLGVEDRGDLALSRTGDLHPTSCAFLPDGDLLVLERGLFMLSFTTRIRRISAEDVHAGAVMDGDILFQASGRDVDNFEGLAVYRHASGETRLAIVSDDNFNSFQRTLLYEFALR